MKIYTKLGVMLLLFSSISILIFFAQAKGAENNEQDKNVQLEVYEYPITPDNPEWAKLGNVENKIAACRIPPNILKNMSDEQLLQAVLDFPFLMDLFAYSNREQGVQSLEKNSDAYAELLKRKTAKAVLMKKTTERTALRKKSLTSAEEVADDCLATLILYQKDFQNCLSLEDAEEVSKLSSVIELKSIDKNSSSEIYATKITTPNGTVVPYQTNTCSHYTSNFHKEKDEQIAASYGVTIISYGSCKYNCHSYAWYSQSSANGYWIPNPSVYMTDGSYTQFMSGINSSSSSAVSGNKLIYGTKENPDHSAIITGAGSGMPLASRTVKSKWGEHGVFSHAVTRVPNQYDQSNVSVWRR